MRNTVLSAAHMVRNPVSPGGEDMVKVRLQGTKEDMEWLEEQLKQVPSVRIMESSEIYSNKGTNKYFRKYLEVEMTLTANK